MGAHEARPYKRVGAWLVHARIGAERYAFEDGNFPPNGIAGLHPNLRGSIPETVFNATTTPLGGVWDWDYQQRQRDRRLCTFTASTPLTKLNFSI